MLRLFIFVSFLILSVTLGILAVNHPGFLLIVYQPWLIRMPLWFAILALVLFIILFYLLIDSIDRFHLLIYRIKNWFRFRRENQFYSKTQAGLAALIEGEWVRAEQSLLAGINQSLEPLINYLGAAKAAQLLGAMDRRDQYLKDAYKIAPKSNLAIGLTQAKLEIEANQYIQAQATLNRLLLLSPRHPQVLVLLEKVYVHLQEWQALLQLVPAMRKTKVLSSTNAEILEKNLYCELFKASLGKSLGEVQTLWHDVPRALKKHPEIVYQYVTQLYYHQAFAEANTLIRSVLQKEWHGGLVEIYSQLPFDDLNKQLVIAGAWLKHYGPKQEILLFLGELCVRVQLWGKAKDYFEKCLQLGPNAKATLAYGNLLLQLGEKEEALHKFKEGLVQR